MKTMKLIYCIAVVILISSVLLSGLLLVLNGNVKYSKALRMPQNRHFQPEVSNVLSYISEINYLIEKENYTSVREWKLKQYQFQPIVNASEYQQMLQVWQTFTEICNQNYITYILYGGTLLGSYRHHGFVPWDDDIDVIVKKNDVTQLENILSEIPGYGTKRLKHCLKFFKNQTKNLPSYGWGWPFVDIFFYEENQTHLWDGGWPWEFISWEKKKFFPLKFRPFEDQLHPVPFDVVYALKQEEKNPLICQTNIWNHKLEFKLERSKSVNCSNLALEYPFVHRVYQKDSVKEILQVNGTVLSSYIFYETR